ncbi:hypothetical protein D3C84_897480 [compost metagenome]
MLSSSRIMNLFYHTPIETDPASESRVKRSILKNMPNKTKNMQGSYWGSKDEKKRGEIISHPLL